MTMLKKIWYFIWEDNSIWSWIVNLILAFVLIKFLVYPGLGLLLGTSYPVVAVVSGSMEHDGSFEAWWQSDAYCNNKPCSQEDWYSLRQISKDDFKTYSFKNGFNKGDIMVLVGVKPQNIKVGDVLVFVNTETSDPIIHRVVEITKEETMYIIQTKGDHNTDSGAIDRNISEQAIIGKAIVRIPLLGWIKIVFVEIMQVVL